MKACNNLTELRQQFSAVKTGVAGDTIFSAKALLFIAETLAMMKKPGRKKRRATAWTTAISKGMRAGKSIQQIAAEYRERPARRNTSRRRKR